MIDTREELVLALREASELEHGLMVQYLCATMTPKHGVHHELTPAQLTLVQTWRGSIYTGAQQEMAHFGMVQNVLTAVGGASHFARPRSRSRRSITIPRSVFRWTHLRSRPRHDSSSSKRPSAPRRWPRASCNPTQLITRPSATCTARFYAGLRPLPDADRFIGPVTGQDDSECGDGVRVHPTRTLAEARRRSSRSSKRARRRQPGAEFALPAVPRDSYRVRARTGARPSVPPLSGRAKQPDDRYTRAIWRYVHRRSADPRDRHPL